MQKVLALLLCIVIFSTGCASLSGYDRIKYDRLKMKLQRCNLPELTPKSSTTAALLNILPGIGNIYLKQWGMFAVNALLWPWSVVWAIPQAGADAENLNKKETLLHYEHGFGVEDLRDCEPSLAPVPVGGGAFTPEERRQIREEYKASLQKKDKAQQQEQEKISPEPITNFSPR